VTAAGAALGGVAAVGDLRAPFLAGGVLLLAVTAVAARPLLRALRT
jgi:hypothetical protein